MTGAVVGLADLVTGHRVVVCCGAGGVGKTTAAAAIGVMAATHTDRRVLVLTVDPARRLATALGLDAIGNTETRIDPTGLAAARPKGELWAAMLDTKASWDDLVRRHAPDDATAAAILANPLYRNVTGTFVQSHDYIAMERLHEMSESGRWDLIVVDTPPSRNAIDFLEAPGRMADFFSSKLLRWLTTPVRSRTLTFASRPFFLLADRILGARFLSDIGEFFGLFQGMYDGFVDRARSVQRLLADPATTFAVITTLEPGPVREADQFVAELRQRRYDLGAVVLNRVLPGWLTDTDAAALAEGLTSAPVAELAERFGLGPDDDVGAASPRVIRAVATNHAQFALLAGQEAGQRRRLGADATATATVPWFGGEVTDIDALHRIGAALWAADPTTDPAG